MGYTLEDYRKAVEYSAKVQLDNTLHNEGNEHARILLSTLLKYSKNHVRIAACNLANLDVVNTREYVNAMLVFLQNPNSKLDILLSNFDGEKVKDIDPSINLFYTLYSSKAYKEGRIKIKNTNGLSFLSNGKPVHFCTSDSHAYRLEHDIEKRIAHGNFGDKNRAKFLEMTFDDAFSTLGLTDIRLENYFGEIA